MEQNKQDTNKTISAILKEPTEQNPNGACEVYIAPDLTYPDIIQLLGTVMLHSMVAFYKMYAHQIRQVNINQKVKENKQTLPKGSTLTESELETATLQAAYQIYDSMNIAVSNVLEEYTKAVPGMDFLNPEDLITNEAILEAEQNCLNNLLDSLTPAQKTIATKRLDRIKEDIAKAKDDYARLQFETEQNQDSLNDVGLEVSDE